MLTHRSQLVPNNDINRHPRTLSNTTERNSDQSVGMSLRVEDVYTTERNSDQSVGRSLRAEDVYNLLHTARCRLVHGGPLHGLAVSDPVGWVSSCFLFVRPQSV